MKKCTCVIMMCLMAMTFQSMAAATDVTIYDNVLFVPKTKLFAGNQVGLPLMMNNKIDVRGFQCDIHLPEGLSFVQNATMQPVVALSSSRVSQQMNCYSTVRADGALRIVCNSSAGYCFSGNEGEVLQFGVKASDTLAAGKYELVINNIHFSDQSAHDYTLTDSIRTLLVIRAQPVTDESPAVSFADSTVREICVDEWDLDLNGEFSENEAVSVKDLGQAFSHNSTIRSFEELKYFTGLSVIAASAFGGCKSLTSISLPVSLTSVGSKAFSGLDSLAEIDVAGLNPPSAALDAFSGTDISKVWLCVPYDSREAYKAADVWKDFGKVDYRYFNLIYVVDGETRQTVSVPLNAPITPLENPVREGYSFSGWSEMPAVMPAHDVTVTGSFAVNSYVITYLVDNEVYHRDTLAYGAAITPFAAPVKEGHTFSGWSEIPAAMPAHDVTVTGSFAVNSYVITYLVDNEVYHRDTLAYGAAVTPLEAPAKEGHTFSGWSEIPATMPAHDVTVTGSFAVNSYVITYLVDNEVYHRDTLAYGAAVTPLEAPVKEGHTFSGWSEIPATMPAHDVTVTGNFTVGLNEVLSDEIVDVKYFTLDGKEIVAPEEGMTVIEMVLYSNGRLTKKKILCR